jgi:hypothetical protein
MPLGVMVLEVMMMMTRDKCRNIGDFKKQRENEE